MLGRIMSVPAYENNTLCTHRVRQASASRDNSDLMLNDDGKDTVRGLPHLTCICTVSLHLIVSAC